MPETTGSYQRLEMAHVLYIDLVGYARLPLEEQHRAIAAFLDIMRGLPTYQRAEAEDALLSHPAEDGVAPAFFDDPSAATRCALEVAEAAYARDDLLHSQHPRKTR